MLDLRIIKTCGGFLYQGWSHSSASKPLVQNKVDAEQTGICVYMRFLTQHTYKACVCIKVRPSLNIQFDIPCIGCDLTPSTGYAFWNINTPCVS